MTDYKYLFGPVPSRRLGISLGVDLVPHKVCSLNCVYCECGKTTKLTTERKEYVPTETVLAELAHYLNQKPILDYITFSGSGEPTLHSKIGVVINFLKEKFPSYKIALLTNGTLLYLKEVRDEVNAVDLILPSLDAASESIFRKINRPPRHLTIEKVIAGLEQFRAGYAGKMWLEVFIIPGLNDSQEDIENLRTAIERIKPDLVQLNTLDRPGTEEWVQPGNGELLHKIKEQLNWRVEIIANFKQRERIDSYNSNIENAIIQTIKRRPCTVEDLEVALGLHSTEINKYLTTLLSQDLIATERMERGIFFKIPLKLQN